MLVEIFTNGKIFVDGKAMEGQTPEKLLRAHLLGEKSTRQDLPRAA